MTDRIRDFAKRAIEALNKEKDKGPRSWNPLAPQWSQDAGKKIGEKLRDVPALKPVRETGSKAIHDYVEWVERKRAASPSVPVVREQMKRLAPTGSEENPLELDDKVSGSVVRAKANELTPVGKAMTGVVDKVTPDSWKASEGDKLSNDIKVAKVRNAVDQKAVPARDWMERNVPGMAQMGYLANADAEMKDPEWLRKLSGAETKRSPVQMSREFSSEEDKAEYIKNKPSGSRIANDLHAVSSKASDSMETRRQVALDYAHDTGQAGLRRLNLPTPAHKAASGEYKKPERK